MSVLSQELLNDPAGCGYSLMTNQEVENSINDKRYPVVGKLPINEFIGILYDLGVFDSLFDQAEAGNLALQKEIKRLQTLKSFGVENLDMTNSSVISRLVATGIPDSVITILKNKATTMKSRADILELGFVYTSAIRDARA